MKRKLIVVWICHFSNNDVRERLPISKMKLKNKIKSLLGKKITNNYWDHSPWVTNLIIEFEKFKDIELHVISPFLGLTRLSYEFEMKGVFYHFYKPDLPIFHITLSYNFYFGSKPFFFRNRYLVNRFIKKIRPDIVNLIGCENPYYSITTLDIRNIPVYVSAQTVYANPELKKYSDNFKQLIFDIEQKIHKKEMYFGCTGRMHRDLILKNNPNSIIFKMFFPIERPKQVKAIPKIFDFVFFAGIAKIKGVEDLIEALAIVKKKKNDVTLNIIGTYSKNYMRLLLDKINGIGLSNNIIFHDYFPIHSEMHQHVVQSRFAVLPVKVDIIPGSVIEAILLDLPVVTYKTTGTPWLNKERECVLIASIGDIDSLAENMLSLINSPSLANMLKENAKAFIEKEYDNVTSAKRLVSNYRAVLEHYFNRTPIPEEQLFNINEFPLY